MTAIVKVPREFLEAVADLQLPASAERRLQMLTDRYNEKTLGRDELTELGAWYQLGENIGRVREEALRLLGCASKPA